MDYKPRQYQTEAVQSLFAYFNAKSGNPLIALPTGTGKSLVIALFLKEVYKHFPQEKVLVVTHVKELIQQNYNKLKQLWPTAPAGIYSSGLAQREYFQRITFCGIKSIKAITPLLGSVGLVLVDEAHLVNNKENTEYFQFIEALKTKNPHIKVIGLTATPYRLGQGLLTNDGLFTDICYDLTSFSQFNKLIEDGYLCRLITKKTAVSLDLEGVHVRQGDYVQSEVAAAFSRQGVTKLAINDILCKASDRKHILVFATDIDHAEEICALFKENNVEAEVVHSRMPDKKRDESIVSFLCGKVRVLVNMGVLTTGFDFPALDCIVVLRATTSPGLWVQILGRGTRIFPGKDNCLVLDYANNIDRLGPVNDPVLPRQKGKGAGEAPVKLCPQCETYNHASKRECTECGYVFPAAVKINETSSLKDILKLDEEPLIQEFKVTTVSYNIAQKEGKQPYIKIVYSCGLRFFNQFLFLEHTGYAAHQSRKLWREMCYPENIVPPTTTHEALTRIQDGALKQPSKIRVHLNKKPFPEVLSMEYEV